jgi:hypothetical protein
LVAADALGAGVGVGAGAGEVKESRTGTSTNRTVIMVFTYPFGLDSRLLTGFTLECAGFEKTRPKYFSALGQPW